MCWGVELSGEWPQRQWLAGKILITGDYDGVSSGHG